MTLAQMIPLAIKTSIVLIVFALGLKTERDDAAFLASHPALLARSVLSMNVVMVAVATAIAAPFDLPFVIKLALIAISISPVPPVLPARQEQAGGSTAYAVSLLVFASLAAIVSLPYAKWSRARIGAGRQQAGAGA